MVQTVFDQSASYGSGGTLKAVEVYPYNTFGANETANHEVAHQWVDYWNWSTASGGIEMKGHDPDAHTPLLHPGEVMTGAVLEHDRRVRQQTSAVPTAHGPAYDIERSPTPQVFHPTYLYRMGLIPASEVPVMQVFENQGQFDEKTSKSPDVGAAIAGDHREVHINTLMAQEGARSGPVPSLWRIASIVVSRDGLISKEEMDYWNFYAARRAVAEGVRSYDGNPSFREATRSLLSMRSDIDPKPAEGIAKIEETPPGSFASLGTTDWRGVRFDSAVPGRITIAATSTSGLAALSKTVTLSGALTATDRTDFNALCLRPRRYAAADPNEMFKCFTVSGNRFTASLTFEEQQRGAYILDVFLFWPDSGSQYPRTALGVLYVD